MTLRSPWGVDGDTYDDDDMRLLAAALSSGRSGVAQSGDYAPTPQGTPNDTIRIAAGTAVIPATAAGELGSFVVANDATMNSPAFTPTSSNPRWDYLLLRVVSGVPELHVVQGTPAGSPSYPSLAGLDDYIVLCGVKFPASASVINNSTGGIIDDLRVQWDVTADDTLPWLIDVDVFMTAISAVNWNTLTISTGLVHNCQMQSTGAQNAEINFDVLLAKGTWTFELMHHKDVTLGIYTVTVGSIAAGTIDGYTAGTVLNARSSLTGIVIPTTGKYRLKLKMATKNASSSSYFGAIQHIQLRRTA